MANRLTWYWEEAFDKHGFGFGTETIRTDRVRNALIDAGYEVKLRRLRAYNTIIFSIKKDGTEHIPEGMKPGYIDPRTYLPPSIIKLLDDRFSSGKSYRFCH